MSHHTKKSLTRRLVYLNVFVDFLAYFYVTFLKDSDKNVSIIIFEIEWALNRKRSYSIKIKRKDFRDIDFYNIIISIENSIEQLEFQRFVIKDIVIKIL